MKFLTKYLALHNYYDLVEKLIPYVMWVSIICLSYGMYAGLWLAPADYQQGDGFRIIYVHVPAAFLSLAIYVSMAFYSAAYLIWRIKLYAILARASVVIGASFTFIALVTGSIWARPMWGAWWVWDARLTSELILFFLYLGYYAVYEGIENHQLACNAASLLAVFGVLNVPIIHFSVNWWNTLHQGATLSKFSVPSIAPAMLYPLLAMIIGCFAIYFVVLMLRSKLLIEAFEAHTQWLQLKLKGRGV